MWGVYLEGDESVRVIEPYGLNDLFELRVRHNPLRASASTYMNRVRSKQFGARWLRLFICTP
ncbi:nucleotidyltransferase family protein [Achromobacter pestifer]